MNFNDYTLPDLTNKTIVITGANSGIGLYCAKQFCKQGAQVVIACRNKQRSDKAIEDIKNEMPNAKCQFIELDLMSFKSIKDFVKSVEQLYPTVDILINNAGVIFQSSKNISSDGFDSHIATNCLGHFLLANKMLKLLKNSEDAKIITAVSMAEKQGCFKVSKFAEAGNLSWTNYAYSKIAALMNSYQFNDKLKQAGITNVKSIACHPGLTASNSPQMSAFNKVLINFIGMPLAKGTIPMQMASTDDNLKGGEYIGFDGFLSLHGNVTFNKSSKVTYDKKLQEELWNKCEKLTDCKFNQD
tara:strand:+ start:1815 stop:2714 length:900 start_codon:yes stop_codon:yes gene_type:complete